jgi:hypothetical protein
VRGRKCRMNDEADEGVVAPEAGARSMLCVRQRRRRVWWCQCGVRRSGRDDEERARTGHTAACCESGWRQVDAADA